MRKLIFILLLAVAALVLCTACASVVAAPEPTPTLVPIPTPEETPDPLWVALNAGLQENMAVCLTNSYQFEARLLTGPVVAVNFYWVTTSDRVRIRTVRVAKEMLTREGIVEYETFLFDSEVDLTRFERVVVHIEIESREFEVRFPVERCAQMP